jgi:hypothetical protein
MTGVRLKWLFQIHGDKAVSNETGQLTSFETASHPRELIETAGESWRLRETPLGQRGDGSRRLQVKGGHTAELLVDGKALRWEGRQTRTHRPMDLKRRVIAVKMALAGPQGRRSETEAGRLAPTVELRMREPETVLRLQPPDAALHGAETRQSSLVLVRKSL